MNKSTHSFLIVLIFVNSLFSGLGASADSAKDRLLGRYWFPERDGQFEVYIKESRYYGRVISYDIPGQLDEENADPALRTRRFVGIDMLANFEFDETEKNWTGGTIYDPKNGKTYDCNLWFDAGEPDVLQGRGYIGFAFLGRTESFERVLETP